MNYDYSICTRGVKESNFTNEPGKVRYLKSPRQEGGQPQPAHEIPVSTWVDEVRDLADGIADSRVCDGGDVLVFVHDGVIPRQDVDYSTLTDEARLNAFIRAEQNERRSFEAYGNILLSLSALVIARSVRLLRQAKARKMSWRAITSRAAVLLAILLISGVVLCKAYTVKYLLFMETVTKFNNP